MLLDLRLDDMSGPDVLDTLAEEGRYRAFRGGQRRGDVRIAVDLMKEGALDFLPKDSQLLELVAPVVRRCLEHIEQQQRLAEVESRFLQLANTIQSVLLDCFARYDTVLLCQSGLRDDLGIPRSDAL